MDASPPLAGSRGAVPQAVQPQAHAAVLLVQQTQMDLVLCLDDDDGGMHSPASPGSQPAASHGKRQPADSMPGGGCEFSLAGLLDGSAGSSHGVRQAQGAGQGAAGSLELPQLPSRQATPPRMAAPPAYRTRSASVSPAAKASSPRLGRMRGSTMQGSSMHASPMHRATLGGGGMLAGLPGLGEGLSAAEALAVAGAFAFCGTQSQSQSQGMALPLLHLPLACSGVASGDGHASGEQQPRVEAAPAPAPQQQQRQRWQRSNAPPEQHAAADAATAEAAPSPARTPAVARPRPSVRVKRPSRELQGLQSLRPWGPSPQPQLQRGTRSRKAQACALTDSPPTRPQAAAAAAPLAATGSPATRSKRPVRAAALAAARTPPGAPVVGKLGCSKCRYSNGGCSLCRGRDAQPSVDGAAGQRRRRRQRDAVANGSESSEEESEKGEDTPPPPEQQHTSDADGDDERDGSTGMRRVRRRLVPGGAAPVGNQRQGLQQQLREAADSQPGQQQEGSPPLQEEEEEGPGRGAQGGTLLQRLRRNSSTPSHELAGGALEQPSCERPARCSAQAEGGAGGSTPATGAGADGYGALLQKARRGSSGGSTSRPLAGICVLVTGFDQSDAKAAVERQLVNAGAQLMAELASRGPAAGSSSGARRLSVSSSEGRPLRAAAAATLAAAMSVDVCIAPEERRTPKYLYAASQGCPVLTPEWVRACCAAGSVVVPTGGKARARYVLRPPQPALRQAPVFAGLRMHVAGSRDFVEQFSKVLKHAGERAWGEGG